MFRINLILRYDGKYIYEMKKWVNNIKDEPQFFPKKNEHTFISFNEIKNKYTKILDVFMNSKPYGMLGTGYIYFYFDNEEEMNNSFLYFEKLYKKEKMNKELNF